LGHILGDFLANIWSPWSSLLDGRLDEQIIKLVE
jgi:hypothetical protein